VVVLFWSSLAAAAPQVITVEVDRDVIGYGHMIDELPAAETEPGGLLVPADAGPHWLALGLKPGDLVRYHDGTPATDRLMLGDGLTTLDVVRNGKPVMLRIVIHGPAVETSTVKESDYQDVLKRLARNDPHATPLKDAKGTPSGVRVVDIMLHFELELAIGDIVRTIDGKPVRTEAEFIAALQNLRVGQTDIEVERYGRNVTVQLTRVAPLDLKTITKLSATKYELPRALADAIAADPQLLGHNLETSEQGKGVRLSNIAPDSVCAALGLANEDIVVDVEGLSVATYMDALHAVGKLSGEDKITVNILRKNKKLAITYTIR
jgi:S1-C subfamily serine protease